MIKKILKFISRLYIISFVLIFIFVIPPYLLVQSNDGNESIFYESKLGYNTVDLNVRSSPSINGSKKSVLKKRSEILISNYIIDGWVMVGSKDSSSLGYVSLEYIRDDNSNKIQFDNINEIQPEVNSKDVLTFKILLWFLTVIVGSS